MHSFNPDLLSYNLWASALGVFIGLMLIIYLASKKKRENEEPLGGVNSLGLFILTAVIAGFSIASLLHYFKP